MMIVGVDYHPSFQTIAFLMEQTGEYDERELNHSDGEAERFYRDLKQRGIRVRVGMEATGYSRWFERLLAELGFELWIGDPAEIEAKRVKKRKTDREDARLLLKLMREDRFPRIWVPSPENRDLRQLLWHRHRLVQMRTRIMNQLQALAMNEGKRWKKKLWSERGRAELEKLALAPWASRRRKELLELLDRMDPNIEELTTAAQQEAKKRPEALRLMTHPGVGPITALAYALIIGTPERFHCGKQVGTYVGLIPIEDSSGGKQRLGLIKREAAVRLLAQQALEQSFEENAIAQGQARELHAHAFVRIDASHDAVGLYAASGHFKNEYQLRTHWWWIGGGDKHTSHSQSPDARDLLPAAAVPGHEHALGQGDSFISALNQNGFLGHAGSPIQSLEFQAPEVEARFLKLQAKFPTAPVCLPRPNEDNFARIFIGQINQPQALPNGKPL